MNKLIPILVTAFVLVACGKDKGGGDNAGGKAGGGDKAASGIGDKLLAAQATANSNDVWSETTARLEKELGAPKSKTDTEWKWAVVEGDACYNLTLTKQSDADKVSGTMGGRVPSGMADKFDACKKLATGTP
jgi:hypothetical protein